MLYARNFIASDASEVDRSNERVPQEVVVGDSLLVEGARLTAQVNAFERNPQARAQCLAHYGMRCAVRDFSFESVYGPVANSYSHVHHLNPLAFAGAHHCA